MAGTTELHILTWNVRGLSEPHRKVIARDWINAHVPRLDVMMIQELKADDFCLKVALDYILPNFQQIIAYPDDGRGGTALLIHPKFKIVNSGTTTRGMAWATIYIAQEIYHLGSVYAPNTASARKQLWHAIMSSAQNGKWIIAGDFNMTEDRNNFSSK
jgi:exonuclease III